MRFWAIIMGKTEKRIGHLLCMAGTFLAVASVQFCPVKAYSVSTSTVISIVGALLCWRMDVLRTFPRDQKEKEKRRYL